MISMQEEEIRARTASHRNKRRRSRSRSRRSSSRRSRRKHKLPRRGSSSRSRSPRSGSRDSEHHKRRRKSRSKRDKLNTHSGSDRSESSADSSLHDGVTDSSLLTEGGGNCHGTSLVKVYIPNVISFSYLVTLANSQESVAHESARDDRELHQHITTSANDGMHAGSEANAGSSSLVQDEELDGRTTEKSEPQSDSGDESKDDKEVEEAKENDDSQGLLELYLKQYQQEKLEHQSDQYIIPHSLHQCSTC